MRWPWRRRDKGGRVVFIGDAPWDVAAAMAAVPTPSPVVSAWVPDPPAAVAPVAPVVPVAAPPGPDARAAVPAPSRPVPAYAGAPQAPVAAPPWAGVQLGFADGTVMTLSDDDPRAVALRAAAARLTATGK